MREKLWIVAGFWLVVSLTSVVNVYAAMEDTLYAKAIEQVRLGKNDFAFMYYNQIDREYPHSRYSQQILMAKGEYFYELPAFVQAAENFNILINEFPESPERLFALGYLYKIAQSQADDTLVENLKKEILTFRQVGLVFKDTKEYKYRSPFRRNFKAVFYIDKIEFYRGGELFATVSN